jgi:hypothetical protein
MPADEVTTLTRYECERLVGSVPFGRIVFTSDALPAIRLVRHVLLGRQIIIRAGLGAVVRPGAGSAGTVVAYEVDVIDADQRIMWSVVVIGRAHQAASEALAARCREAAGPWADVAKHELVTIDLELVNGYRADCPPAR